LRRFIEDHITKPIVVYQIPKNYIIDKENSIFLPIEDLDLNVDVDKKELNLDIYLEMPI
jgi:hypothetical protein